jgi:hypothetical protein
MMCVFFFTLKPEPETTQHYAWTNPKPTSIFPIPYCNCSHLKLYFQFSLSFSLHRQQPIIHNNQPPKTKRIAISPDLVIFWQTEEMGFEATCDPQSLTRNCEPGIVATCQESHRRSGPWETKRREGKGREKGSKRGDRERRTLSTAKDPLCFAVAL